MNMSRISVDSLRCVVFHNITKDSSPFTDGINVSITPQRFEAALRYLKEHYNPVHLEDVLTHGNGTGLPPRPLLITFDDAYASVVESAASLCLKYNVPAVFFINGAFIDNQQLSPDNLVCYIANVYGMNIINAAIHAISASDIAELRHVSDVFAYYLPNISLDTRKIFLDSLQTMSGINGNKIARKENLYLTRKQLRCMKNYGFEIGNHTYSHTYCRSYTMTQLVSEVDINKQKLEALSGTVVRSFSVPYGSARDLTIELKEHLISTGHHAIFLSESVANPYQLNHNHIDRVSMRAESDCILFMELEIYPRLRAIRNKCRSKSSI